MVTDFSRLPEFSVVIPDSNIPKYQMRQTYMQKAGDSWDISPQFFLDFLGWEREISTAPKPSPEVAPSKMEVAQF